MSRLPALFVTHGSPTLPLDDAPARDFLKGLGKKIGRPDAILAISAHWEAAAPTVSTTERPETIHDFYGFPAALYEMSYPAPGAPEAARRAKELAIEAGLGGEEDSTRGLDHGAWSPLILMYPEADVPVTQLSVQTHLGPLHHLALGQALRPLRDEGVLILASGSATHNLRDFRSHTANTPALDYVAAFDDWLVSTVEANDRDALADYRNRAPEAEHNHPTEEHFLPLFVAAGASESAGRTLHRSATFGIIAMTAFAFD